MQTDISIVIAAYNGEAFLAETLDSVLAQSVSEWECVIVDDGSRDGTLALAEAYAARDARIRVVHQANAGGGSARDRGFAEALPSTRFVAFIDQDDVYTPEALAVLRQALEHNSCAVAAHGLATLIDGSSKPIRTGESAGGLRLGLVDERLQSLPPEAPTTLATLAVYNCIYTPGQGLIRREALARVGPHDARVQAADWDMWLRLSLLGDITYTPHVVLAYRLHATSMTHRTRQPGAGASHVRRKLLGTTTLTDEQRAIARLIQRYGHAYDAAIRLRWARGSMRRGDALGAARQLRHVLRAYTRFVLRAPI